MKVSNQFHTPASLNPWKVVAPTEYESGWPQSESRHFGEEKNLFPRPEPNPRSSSPYQLAYLVST
jgi:hypothetical protein